MNEPRHAMARRTINHASLAKHQTSSGVAVSTRLFFDSGPGVRLFENIRGRVEDCQRIEAMWHAFEPICGDPVHAFLANARHNPWSSIWEMCIAEHLRHAGLQLAKPPPEGPDLCASLSTTQNLRVWIEATTVDRGTGPDAVPPPARLSHVDHDAMIRRYTCALEAKLKQTQAFRIRGIVRDDDAVVLAINACAIEFARLDSGIPDIVRAVYPIGPRHFVVPIASDTRRTSRGKPRAEHFYRATIPRVGRPDGIPASAFLHDRYRTISAVLFCAVDPIDAQARHLVLVHNAGASVQVPRGALPCGQEYWMALDETGKTYSLEHTDYRSSSNG